MNSYSFVDPKAQVPQDNTNMLMQMLAQRLQDGGTQTAPGGFAVPQGAASSMGGLASMLPMMAMMKPNANQALNATMGAMPGLAGLG